MDEGHEFIRDLEFHWSSDGTTLHLTAQAPVGLEAQARAYLEHMARFTIDNFTRLAEEAQKRWEPPKLGLDYEKMLADCVQPYFAPSRPILITDCTS